MSLDHVGPVADQIEILELARPMRNPDGTLQGQVCLVDRFGNLITNVSMLDVSAARIETRSLDVYVGDKSVGPLRGTYADAAPGTALALIGSSQMLEIAVNHGNAAAILGVGRGAPVRVG